MSLIGVQGPTLQKVENYFHVYNRGVEKRVIFLDEQDHGVFLSYLKEYLSQKDEPELRKGLAETKRSDKEKDKIRKSLRLNNYSEGITLLAYCLMPNHFHFFIKQNETASIDEFMHSLCTRYVMYFNRKYKRVGPLFQGRYKAILVTEDSQFVHLSRYIHRQALALQGPALQNVHPSSYPEYIGERVSGWVHPEDVLEFFPKTNSVFSYESFMKDGEPGLQGPALQIEED